MLSSRSENHYQSLVSESVSGVGIENISIEISPVNVFINSDLQLLEKHAVVLPNIFSL